MLSSRLRTRRNTNYAEMDEGGHDDDSTQEDALQQAVDAETEDEDEEDEEAAMTTSAAGEPPQGWQGEKEVVAGVDGDDDATDEDEPSDAAMPAATAPSAPSQAASLPPAAPPVGASGDHGRAEWQVLLRSSYRPYEDGAVQEALERAWQQDAAEVEIQVRGAAYVVRLRGQMVQETKGDPTRWRSVRRVLR